MDDMMSESMDIKRFVLTVKKSIWKVFAAALIFAVLFAAAYLLAAFVLAKPFPYRSGALYYIDFDQRTASETQLYYNDYTWNDVIDSDMIAGRASQICGISKEEIAEAASTYTMSDIRMIRLYVDMPDAQTAEKVQEAIGTALAEFASEAEGFESITQWDHEEAREVIPEDHSKRWAVLGALTGIIAGFLLLMYDSAMDDRIYTEKDVKDLCGHSALAVLYKDGSEDKDSIRKLFAKVLAGCAAVSVSCFEKEDEALKEKVKGLLPEGCSVSEDAETELVIVIWGISKGRKLRRYTDELKLCEKRSLIVIAEADRKFFGSYYEV